MTANILEVLNVYNPLDYLKTFLPPSALLPFCMHLIWCWIPSPKFLLLSLLRSVFPTRFFVSSIAYRPHGWILKRAFSWFWVGYVWNHFGCAFLMYVEKRSTTTLDIYIGMLGCMGI
ncbi:hypothetical protein BGW36DRAFT_106809 [Talaromyces proteolyticus]|uniref:Uncharacterized protein n=1 Tax=Talaromyces proteolyticus TaxID=1131652 RepID=A0AAD4L273_9EURO|nr:uncharacterized protein BGW36DRAFT_106809 [Talaromyces proteolyticus]KAH8701864.1 hypothetical protein BGW36DRAFT_106809 [Talaromyces proteolyticus]